MPLSPEKQARLDQLLAKAGMSQPQQDQGFSIGETFSNVPGSALQYGKDMIYPFMNPGETWEGMKGLGQGVYQKFTPGVQPQEAIVDAVGQYYKDRYGGIDEALNTLQTDPVGTFADLSMGGGVLGKVTKSSKIANVSRGLDPLALPINATAAGTRGLLGLMDEGTPAQWWQEAAKIPRTQRRPTSKIDTMVDTALREGIMPTSEGVGKLNRTVSILNDQIDTAIDAATNSGGTVSKDMLYKHLKALRKEIGGPRINAAQDLETIDRVVGAFNEHMTKTGKSTMTARELQEFKKDAYKQIDFDRSQQKSDPATNQTRKAMAKAAKEGVEELVPTEDIRSLNAREGALLQLRDPLEQAAGRIERRDKIGIGLPIKGMAGMTIGDWPGAALGIASGILDSPKMKSRAALGMYGLRQSPISQLLSKGRMRQPYRQGLLETSGLLQDEEFRESLGY